MVSRSIIVLPVRGLLLTTAVVFLIYGVKCIEIPLHELGHAIFAMFKGGHIAGIPLEWLPMPHGQSQAHFPLIEIRYEAMSYWYAGGPVVTILIGLVAFVLSYLRPVSRSVLSLPLVIMAATTLGHFSAGLLIGGLFQGGLEPVDVYAVGVYQGLSHQQIQLLEIVIGSCGVLLVGLWWPLRMISQGLLPTKTPGQRIWLLICSVWLPVVIVSGAWFIVFLHVAGIELSALSTRSWETNAALVMKSGYAKGILLGAVVSLPFLALVAYFIRIETPRTRSLTMTLLSSCIIVLMGLGIFALVDWLFQPPMVPSARQLEAMLARSPNDPDVMRSVAHFLVVHSLEQNLPQQKKTELLNRVYELRRQALEADPENPGAFYDLAQYHRAQGDRHNLNGRHQEATSEWKKALGYIRESCDRQSDNPAYFLKMAKLYRLLGSPDEERRALESYVQAVESSGVFPGSRETHIGHARKRIQLIERQQKAAPQK